MKIAIVFHSKTGTTKKFAEIIADALKRKNHSIDLIELKVTSLPKIRTEDAQIENIPDCSKYDLVMIGSPVWGGAATPVTITCLKKMTGIKGKKVLPFITMGFPFISMGGKQTANRISKLAKEAGATPLQAAIVPKMFHKYSELMKKEAEDIANRISG
jgi:flavodoxin